MSQRALKRRIRELHGARSTADLVLRLAKREYDRLDAELAAAEAELKRLNTNPSATAGRKF